MLGSGCGMFDVACWMWDDGCGMLGVGSLMWGVGCGVSNSPHPTSHAQHPGPGGPVHP